MSRNDSRLMTRRCRANAIDERRSRRSRRSRAKERRGTSAVGATPSSAAYAEGLHGAPVLRLSRGARRALAAALVAAGLLTAGPLLMATSTPSIANDADTKAYRLEAMDKIRLKVFEWRATRDEVFEWRALNDQYTVGAGGRLSLPIIGEVRAAGLTVEELSKTIGERMKTEIGLIEAPNISVEVVLFRPFYITGRVANPGEFAYRPNLTVLQALSIAGGIYRLDKSAGLRLEREAIQGRGEIDLVALERDSLIARRARIEADLKGNAAISFPASLDSRDANVQRVLQEETAILVSLREAFNAQLDPLVKLKAHLDDEAGSLRKQLQTHAEEVKLAEEELSNVKKLADKRLVGEQRRIGVQRNVYQLAADHMRLEMNLMRVRQETTRTDLQISELKSKRANDLTQELRATQAKIDEATRRYDTLKTLLLETAMAEGQLSATGDLAGFVAPSFRIVRKSNGMPIEIAADENTRVEPGDTIKVDMGRTNIPLSRRFRERDLEQYAPPIETSKERSG